MHKDRFVGVNNLHDLIYSALARFHDLWDNQALLSVLIYVGPTFQPSDNLNKPHGADSES